MDIIIDKLMKKNPRRTFRIENARDQIKVDLFPSFDSVDKLSTLLESELEEASLLDGQQLDQR